MPRTTTDAELGLHCAITRRDFINGLALIPAAAWSAAPAREMERQWGGNAASVYAVAHAVRDGAFDASDLSAEAAGEFEVAIVGGGFSGMAAATFARNLGEGRHRIVLLENHEKAGGAAQRDVFTLGGRTLLAPQGSIVSAAPTPGLTAPQPALNVIRELVPNYERYKVPPARAGLGVACRVEGRLRLFDSFMKAPLAERVKADYVSFLTEAAGWYDGSDWRSELTKLDSITFEQHLRARGWAPEVFAWMRPELAAFFGTAEEISAAAVYRQYGGGAPVMHVLPGGNSELAQAFVRDLTRTGPSRGMNPSMRLGATVVRVEHEATADAADWVQVTYQQSGRLYRLRARAVIMAGGAFITRRVVRDLPEAHAHAFASFAHLPIAWINVALNNSRALDRARLNFLTTYPGKRGSLLVAYDEAAAHPESRDPSRPAVIGMSVPFCAAGAESYAIRAARGRQEMLTVPFHVLERDIREELTQLFGVYGFDPRADIAAISISRWGHGYVFPHTGFLTGGSLEQARQAHGRILFAHTDLDGFSHLAGALGQGYRAACEALERLPGSRRVATFKLN